MAKKQYKDTPGPIIDGPASPNQHHGSHVTGAIPDGHYYAIWVVAETFLTKHKPLVTRFECISVGHVYKDAARVYAEFYQAQFNKETRVIPYALDAWPVRGELRMFPTETGEQTTEIPG